MKKLNTQDVNKIIRITINSVIANEDYFCELDSAVGDGDFGTSLSKGFQAIDSEWDSLNNDDIGKLMTSCGKIIMQNCGGASGPIWGTAFRKAGSYATGKNSLTLEELAEFLDAMVKGVQQVGKAELGDKTLLDALIPVTKSLHQSVEEGDNMMEAVEQSVQAAEDGAENTKEIEANKGRASYLGERSIGHYDPGAKAVSIILADIKNKFFDREFDGK